MAKIFACRFLPGICLWLLLWSLQGLLPCYGQKKALNIAGLHQLVDYSKSEYERQNLARDRQAVVLAGEQANKTMLAKLKVRYRELQSRFSQLGMVISAASVGIQAYPLLENIIRNQALAYSLARADPVLAGLTYQTEIELTGRARSLVNYLTGLSLSIGAVNQMRASDRKLLFDHVLSELSSVQAMSQDLVSLMYGYQASGGLGSLNPFRDFVSMDQQLAEEIIRNAKDLRN